MPYSFIASAARLRKVSQSRKEFIMEDFIIGSVATFFIVGGIQELFLNYKERKAKKVISAKMRVGNKVVRYKAPSYMSYETPGYNRKRA